MSKVDDVVEAIKSVLPDRRPIEHHEPFIKDGSIQVTNKIVNDNNVKELENWLVEKTGAEQAIAVNCGTSALHVGLLALDIGPNEEVILPAATYVASANAISYCGAIPHFIDGTYLNPFKLRQYLSHNTVQSYNRLYRVNRQTERRISAVMSVHLMGNPVDMEEICKIAAEFKMYVIEDGAQSLGSTINGKHCGTFGHAAAISFNNNKIITGNGGGALLTNDPWVAAKAYQLASIARKPHPWLVENDTIAWNYHMGNINAALLQPQLSNFDKILADKRDLAVRYRKALSGMVTFLEPPIPAEPNYWLNTILVPNRDEILTKLHADGIKARAMFTPLHHLPMYKDNPRSDQNMLMADSLFERAICLPSGANL